MGLVFDVCSCSPTTLLVLSVCSLLAQSLPSAVSLHASGAAAGTVVAPQKGNWPSHSSGFLLLGLSPAFLQDLRSLGAREGAGMCGQRQLGVWQCWLGLFPLRLGERPEQLAAAWNCFTFCPNVSGPNNNLVWLKLTSALYLDIICIF